MNKITETRYGTLIYPDKDVFVGRSIEKYGEYSYYEVEFLKSVLREGDIVVDVGANIGAITIPLAKKVGAGGYMVAFEPQQFLYYALCGNVAINNLSNTHVFQRIVSDINNEIKTLPMFDYEREGNFGALSTANKNEIALNYPVKTTTIDCLSLTTPRLIKIDVEGDELKVLKGAKNTIERAKSYLYVECIDTKLAKDIFLFLKEINYTFNFHQTPLFHEKNFFENPVDVLNAGLKPDTIAVSENLFCYPCDEIEKWEHLKDQPFFISLENSLHGKSYDAILES